MERTEQNRLSTVMKYHSQETSNEDSMMSDGFFPFSIISSMEKGALNRYDNIWPYGKYTVRCFNISNNY